MPDLVRVREIREIRKTLSSDRDDTFEDLAVWLIKP